MLRPIIKAICFCRSSLGQAGTPCPTFIVFIITMYFIASLLWLLFWAATCSSFLGRSHRTVLYIPPRKYSTGNRQPCRFRNQNRHTGSGEDHRGNGSGRQPGLGAGRRQRGPLL